MKELMVTLLVLSCTGMVWAQQNEGSGFRPNGGSSNSGSAFGRSSDPGSSIPTVPIVNDESATARRGRVGQGGQVGQGGLRAGRQGNGRSRGAFSTPSANERGAAPSETSRILDSNRPVQDSFQPGSTGLPASNPLLSTSRVSSPSEKPLYLGLPPQAMNVLLSKGRVVAAVNDPNHGEIKISDQNTPKTGPTRKIQPRLVDGSLVFTFTQADIDFIERGSLQFEVPPELKHRYTSATIEVPEVLNRISQASARPTPTPTQNNSSFQADDSRWKLPGQITARQPTQITARQPTQQIQPIQQNDPWVANQLATAERERQARLDYEARMRVQEVRENAALAEQNRQLQAQNAQLLYEQQQRQAAAARIQPQQPIVYPPADRYAQNNPYGQIQQPIVANPVLPPTTESYEMSQIKARVAQIHNEHLQLNNEFQRVKSENASLRSQFDFRNDSRADLAQDGNRAWTSGQLNDKPLAQNKQLSLGAMNNSDRREAKSGNDGFPPAKDRNRNANGNGAWLMMFLLLLISVGMNLYLWAISRGFYMRYQELADELRETFTVTA